MKKLWIAVLCLGLLLCIGCGAKEAESEAATVDKAATVEDGELIVQLAGNPTTGYGWVWELDGDECVTGDDGSYTMDENEENMAGVGGVFEFRFAPAADGSATIRFSYERSWEENSSVDSYEVAVTVENGEITIG